MWSIINNMDFHPLVIHYPIAFLTTYCLLEILRLEKLPEVKVTLLYLGEVSAIVTLIAAIFSTSTLAGESRLGDMYKIFMLMTVIVFGSISLLYLKKYAKPALVAPLALIGLFFIVVAGGLFGATVYGTGFDPYLAPIFKLLNVY